MLLSMLLTPQGDLSVSEMVTLGTAAVSVMTCFVSLWTKNAVSQESEKMRAWVNGSFMRAAVVEAKLEAIEGKQDDLATKQHELGQGLAYIAMNGCSRLGDHMQRLRQSATD